MKKFLPSLLTFLLIAIPCRALTQEQLGQARETLVEMDRKMSILRGYVYLAYKGEVEGITLTTGQKQILKNKYIAEKSGLVELYNQLP